MQHRLKTLLAGGLFLVGVVGLVAIERVDAIKANESLYQLLHHSLGLIAGAAISGLLFEIRDSKTKRKTYAELSEQFLRNPDMSHLIDAKQRGEWVRQILEAQLPSDPGLSNAVYADVVRPYLSESRVRSRLNYQIRLAKRPGQGWEIPALNASPDDYIRLVTDLDYEQVLPALPPKVNVSLIVGHVYKDLDTAFDDDSCIYRDYLPFHAEDLQHVRRHFADVLARSPQPSLANVKVDLWMDGRQLSQAGIDYETSTSRIRIWFTLPPGRQGRVHLRVKVDAPYQRSAGHYLVVFGEPTASPQITFRPGECATPESVLVVHFVQGNQRPLVTRTDTDIDVTFPHDGVQHWLLPRSGLIFLWRDSRHVQLGVRMPPGSAVEPGPVQPPLRAVEQP